MKTFVSLCLLLLLTGSMPAQLPAKVFRNSGSLLYGGNFLLRPDPVKYSSPKCGTFADTFSIAAAPCNGVSVTSVIFNAATRTIVSGTTNTVGVVYRYPNVGTAPDGIVLDALVTVLSYSNNQDPNQTNFTNADVPAATAGFDNNLQPDINQELAVFTGGNSWTGSIAYRIQFVVAGTSTPKVISVAATTIDNDGSNGAICGASLRESVTYSTALNQVLTSSSTNQTVSGNTVTGPALNQAGIGIGLDFANAALYINVTELNWTYSFANTTPLTCAAGSGSASRLGSLNLSCQINFGRNFASVSLGGNVFNDLNGLTDSIVNGAGTGTPSGVPLFANLLDSNGNVVSSVLVAAGGGYSFPVVVAGSYSIQISTVQGVESSPAPAQTLPAGWVNTGENIGTGIGNDGTVNGLLPVTVGAVAIANANFGIEQRPTPNNNTASTQVNPGGTVNLTVPATTFTASDPAGGTVSSIRITAFPNAVSSITINGIQYTAATFPVGGVIVPTNAAGNPTQPILVDPFDGNRTVNIPFVAIDNAGIESSVTANATLPVSAGTTAADASISGRVLDDQGRGAAHTIVLISDQNGNVRNALTNPFGYYRFENLQAGEIFVINVRHKRFSYQSRTVSLTEDFTDVDFVPQP